MKQIKKLLERWKQITPIRRMIFWALCAVANAGFVYYFSDLSRASEELSIAMAWLISVIIELIFILLLLGYMIYFLENKLENKLGKIKKKRLLKRYKEKLSENKFTEVFFTTEVEAPAGKAGDYYWAMKHCNEPRWGAKWQQDEKIYVVLKDGEKEVRNWTIGNLAFFDCWFEFSK